MRNSGFIAPPTSEADFVFGEAVLWAGDIVADTAPIRMSTVLGSCVAVCLFDTVQQFGGMNHYLVPRGGRDAIHGDWAIAQLIKRMQQLGASIETMHGKIFGGGSPLQLQNEEFAVGPGNVTIAREVLASFEIPIVAERVLLSGGLRLFFENWTGTVWLRPHAGKGE
jgi:chemotaxis protein CheD